MFLSLALSIAAPAAEPPRAECRLTAAELAANARLSFQDFDQAGTTPATARKLGERGCFLEAARATEHYLIHGPALGDFERSVVTWHLGQYLAFAGDEAAAAPVMAGTRRAPDPAAELDWNSYVAGTWAFLVKDRGLLEASIQALARTPARRNAMNLALLRRLSKCFGQSYRQAVEAEACKPN